MLVDAVVREIKEEVGVDVTQISYFGSQSWPFPASLMIGFNCSGDPKQPIQTADEIAGDCWVFVAKKIDSLILSRPRCEMVFSKGFAEWCN